MLGFGLLASGVKGLRQYWRELVVVFLLALPQMYLSGVIDKLVGVSIAAAKFSTAVLWYLGFEVFRQGVDVVLPTGAIKIHAGCSVDPILTLLRLAVLFLVMFPIDGIKRILVPLVAVVLTFIVNGIRITIMAFLVAFSHHEAFAYWHTGSGSQVFSMISILGFGWFCRLLLRQAESKNQGLGSFSEP